jgi:hypothetical protein
LVGVINIDIPIRPRVDASDGLLAGPTRPGTEPLADEETEFFEALLAIPGVVGFRTGRYLIEMARSPLFEWAPIIRRVTEIVRYYGGRTGEEIVETPLPAYDFHAQHKDEVVAVNAPESPSPEALEKLLRRILGESPPTQ